MARNNPVNTTGRGNVTDPNVAAWLPLDQPNGGDFAGVVIRGGSADGAVLTVHGTPTYGVVSGVPYGIGGAVTLNGTTDYFLSPAAVTGLDFGTSKAVVEVWVRPDNGVISKTIVGKSNGAAGWRLRVASSGQANFNFGDGTGASNVGSIHINDGKWHRLYATWDGGTTWTLQVDSNPVETTIFTLNNPVSNALSFCVGARSDVSEKFAGQLGDIRITIGNNTNQVAYNPNVDLNP